MADSGFDLFAAARQEMIDEGFDPDFPPEVGQPTGSAQDPDGIQYGRRRARPALSVVVFHR